jgi:AAA domain
MNISFDLPEIEWGDDAASGAEPPHDGDSKPVNFTPTAFQWRDPATIPRREFLYGNRYIRGFVSATVAPGGVGKSSVALVEVVAMAAGRDLLGSAPSAPLKVW